MAESIKTKIDPGAVSAQLQEISALTRQSSGDEVLVSSYKERIQQHEAEELRANLTSLAQETSVAFDELGYTAYDDLIKDSAGKSCRALMLYLVSVRVDRHASKTLHHSYDGTYSVEKGEVGRAQLALLTDSGEIMLVSGNYKLPYGSTSLTITSTPGFKFKRQGFFLRRPESVSLEQSQLPADISVSVITNLTSRINDAHARALKVAKRLQDELLNASLPRL